MVTKPRRERSVDYDPKSHYVDKRKLADAIREYHAVLKTDPDAQVTDYIGDCIIKICNGLSKKGQFNTETNAAYMGEMIGDAILVCLKAVKKFNPDLNTSAFSYFTTCAERAFLHRIENETKEVYNRFNAIVDYADSFGVGSEEGEGDEFVTSEISRSDYVEGIRQKIHQRNAYLASKNAKKQNRPKQALEEFFDEKDDSDE